jgi:hypothetical protein
MEAATPLRKPHVRVVGERLAIDGLELDDDTAVRVVRERDERGEDPAGTVTDAIEIGARVLDREHAAANAEYVKAEFDKASREVESAFADKAREVAEFFDRRVEEVFGPESGQLAKELERRFSDDSSASVQNRVRDTMTELMAKAREDLVRQFSAADGSNPLADFKQGTIRALEQAEARRQRTEHVLLERLGELDKQLEALRLEKRKLEELEEERERGAAKGRTFEELVAEAVDRIAAAQGDDAEAVGDQPGAIGKTGDVLVDIDAAAGPSRGRLVFEAKDRRLSKPKALEELDRAMEERDADFAVLVVPSEDEIPARLHGLREYNGDKLVVALDPDDPSRLPLELGYRLARARVLMHRAGGGQLQADVVRETVERALAAMDDVRRVKLQLTGATSNIDRARELVEGMAERVRAHLRDIDELVAGDGGEEPVQAALDDLG